MSDLRSSLVSHPAKISFTVRRPSPLSRQSSTGPESDAPGRSSSFRVPTAPPLSNANGFNSPLSKQSEPPSAAKPRFQGHSYHRDQNSDSDEDEDNETTDELVTGFDELGVQRVKPKPKPSGPLVIPALANRDWRAVVRARQAATGYLPDGARSAAVRGADGSQGGLGTRDTINSGPQLQGLIISTHQTTADVPEVVVSEDVVMQDTTETSSAAPAAQESLDDLALRFILQGATGLDADDRPPDLDAIPLAQRRDELTAFKEDIVSLPDVATLDDYARVPVEQFGAALLRGMGWKEGTAASRTRKGVIEPYLPQQRPALLGIGAKQRPTEDVPSSSANGKQGGKGRREDRKYIPLVKREALDPKSNGSSTGHNSRRSSRSRSPPGSRDRSRTSSRRHSRSPSPSSRRDRDRERDRDGDKDRNRDRDRDDHHKSRRRRVDEDDGGYRDRDRDRDRRDRDRGRDRDYSDRLQDKVDRSPRRR